jgi:DHA1 family bicyclomycin/chloramphenicol resistance-like MFS transporter
MVGGVSINIYLPGLPQLARDFHASPSAAQLTVTTYFIGLALGQLLGGSASDVHGRRLPVICAMTAFTFASVACGLAPNLYVLGALRLVQGASAAAGVAIGRAVVRDLFAGAAAARYLSRLMLIVGLSPTISPILGGLIIRHASWRATFAFLALLGVGLLFASIFLLPETHARELRRAAGLGSTARALADLLANRVFVGLALIAGLAGGALTGLVVGSSFVVEDVYHRSPTAYGLLFAAGGFVMVVGAQINAHLVGRIRPRRLLGRGVASMVVAAGALLVAVMIPGAGLAAVVPCYLLLFFSWSFVQANTFALALTDHRRSAGTASALIGISLFGFSALVAPLVNIGGSGTATPMAAVIFVCTAGAALALRLAPQRADAVPEAGLAAPGVVPVPNAPDL